jgi:hypothetical protein
LSSRRGKDLNRLGCDKDSLPFFRFTNTDLIFMTLLKMKIHNFLIINVLTLLFPLTVYAQEYPQNYFRQPLDIPVSLAGNFGEIRPNHFHAGIDFRTGKEGLKVHASADGYVSRIKVSPVGYGKVIYITHPNGYVTVYGHLSRYSPEIAKYVKAAQYKAEQFEVELFPKPDEFPVKKGDVIAFSGNTGNSGGPHVHFEIREEKSECPLNPLLFGIKVPDTIAPVIKQIRLVPMDKNSFINGKNQALKLPLHLEPPLQFGPRNYVPQKGIIRVSGRIGVETEVSDRSNNGSGTNQVYELSLGFMVEKAKWEFKMDKICFDDTRYVNAHINYEEKKRSGSTFQRCYLLKNNPSKIYAQISEDGILSTQSEGANPSYTLDIETEDFEHNHASAQVELILEKAIPAPPSDLHAYRDSLSYKDANVRLSIPALAMYEDYLFHQSTEKTSPSWAQAPVVEIMDEYTPLQKSMTLSLKTKDLSPETAAHAGMVKVEKSGKLSWEGGTWKDGWMTAQTKEFGKHSVVTDNIPPALALVYPASAGGSAKLEKGKTIRLTVSDNLSGFQKAGASIDGHWVLMEYEPKQNLLTIDTKDTDLTSGKHVLEVKATDEAGNMSNLHIILSIP